MAWSAQTPTDSTPYTCGFCSNRVVARQSFIDQMSNRRIRVCSHCESPTLFGVLGDQFPGAMVGSEVLHLPSDLEAIYNEARKCLTISAYTSSVLLCRKLLMNIGVAQGAEEGKQFVYYVDYLANKGFVPPNGRLWVDHIRKKGNEATHEIRLMGSKEAEELIMFSEMLLKFVFEFPGRLQSN